MTANDHSKADQKVKMTFPKPPVFEDKHAEREYLKGRLAAAFRIFGKNGFDEGIHPPSIHPYIYIYIYIDVYIDAC